ncbi:2-hydroxyacid dehydrogenase [Bdellovibrio svalbardensis]|uniref:2-hydroxyacid dehydrogenase n=1 Tax=Bdellovibrio svalbardensis TaxID=2972972 RepID=A0ABT6DES8_9BACT|nr:2-hydroxyacid dehydrogenase [Bdellovibrio svalbardensis]MDG0815331.1 2-hydroxyacid dehydrogenase [Bdellovibrio svalbardensis]
MKVAFFSAKKYEVEIFKQSNQKSSLEFHFFESRLTEQTAQLAKGHHAVCCFVNDVLDAPVLRILADLNIKYIALRCAGYNNIDLNAAQNLGLQVFRVPEYSPYAVAEHATALLLTLNRKIHRAHNRVRELNFALDGLVGFDLHGKTVGVIGTGKIGRVFATIMKGFGCRVLAFDPHPNTDLKIDIEYVTLNEIYRNSDVLSLHCPLNEHTRYLLNEQAFGQMKRNAILINTGRGAIIDTKALINALKTHQIGGACLDVYEEEEGIFFNDQSIEGIEDDILARLTTFPNVLITSHQAFLTKEALANIATTTIQNLERTQIPALV